MKPKKASKIPNFANYSQTRGLTNCAAIPEDAQRNSASFIDYRH